MILHYKSKSGLGREGFWQKGKIKDKGGSMGGHHMTSRLDDGGRDEDTESCLIQNPAGLFEGPEKGGTGSGGGGGDRDKLPGSPHALQAQPATGSIRRGA